MIRGGWNGACKDIFLIRFQNILDLPKKDIYHISSDYRVKTSFFKVTMLSLMKQVPQ